MSRRFVQRIRIFLGKLSEVRNRGIFLKDHRTLTIGEYLKRISLTYSKGPPDLLGNDYSTEVIDSSYYPCCLHAHPSLVIILPWPNSAYALEPIPLSVKSGWNREGRGRITQSCEENTKEAYDDLLSGCCIPICDYPTPFGTEQPVHGIQQPLIDQRPNLGIMLQSLDCNTTLSLVR